MLEIKTISLFLITAVAEIVGCYLPYLWLTQGKSIWLLVPAAVSLALFAWLLQACRSSCSRQEMHNKAITVGNAKRRTFVAPLFPAGYGAREAFLIFHAAKNVLQNLTEEIA